MDVGLRRVIILCVWGIVTRWAGGAMELVVSQVRESLDLSGGIEL